MLAMGWHAPSISDLCTLCVERFPESTSRRRLWEKLLDLLRQLHDLRIPCDVWIDGSMLTTKPNPSDIDMVVHMDATAHVNLTEEQRALYRRLNSAKECDPDTDTHCFVTWPEGNQNHAEGQWMHAFYLQRFGWSRDMETKGIVKLTLPFATDP